MLADPQLLPGVTEALSEGIRAPLSMLADPSERIYWVYLVAAGAVALGLGAVHRLGRAPVPRRSWLHPSCGLDVKLLFANTILRALGTAAWSISAFGLALWVVGQLDARFGIDGLTGIPPLVVAGTYTLLLFIAWDGSRYLLHRLLHRVPALWELHKVHHSAQVLTPLTLYRTHPVESLLYAARGVVVTGVLTGLFFHLFREAAVEFELLGVNVLGFGFNLLGANLRHSHVWWSWGRLERWLISPAQHQIHHAADAGRSMNLGTWLSVWDRAAGTLRLAGPTSPRAFGLSASEANHDPHRLASALWEPLRAAAARLRPSTRHASALVAFLLTLAAAGLARGAPPESATGSKGDVAADDNDDDDDDGDEKLERTIVVGSMFDQDALPRVAGSAHVIGQRELEKHEYDDVHRVLGSVPGVYVRGEDGFGLRPNIGLRGANPDRSAKVTLMEDGVLLGPAPYSAPAAYYFPLATRMVGIEVFKGPSAIRYGPNTIGGAINLRTRDIPQVQESAIDVAAGRFGYGKGHGYWGTTHAGFGAVVEVARVQSTGFKELDGGGDTGFGKNDTMLKLGYHTPAGARIGHAVTLKAGFANERSNETYLGLSEADFRATPYRRYAASARDRMTWWRSQVELTHVANEGEVLSVETRLYRHDFHRVWRRLDAFSDGPDLSTVLAHPDAGQSAVLSAILRGEENSERGEGDSDDAGQALILTNNDRRYASEGIQSALHWRPRRARVAQDFELGARLHHDYILREHTEDAFWMTDGILIPEGSDSIPATRNRGEAVALALHAYDAITLWDRVTIAPGLRMEAISLGFQDDLANLTDQRVDFALTPGAGVLVRTTPWLDAFGGVHRGFSPVTPGQPEEVKPEYSANYEAGLRALRGGINAEAVGFVSDYGNLNGACTDSSGCQTGNNGDLVSAGRVLVYGAETRARYRHGFDVGIGVELGAQYTYTGSRFLSAFKSQFPQWGEVAAGDQLPYVPEHLVGGTAGIGGRIWDVSVRTTYNGAMRDVAGQGPISKDERVPGFFTLDLATEVRIKQRLRLYALVNNATNSAYMASRRPFGIRPGAPLTFMFGVTAYLFA